MRDIKLNKQKLIDHYIGNLINLFLIFHKKLSYRILNKKPKKIIVYKLDAIGDSILCLPMIKILKKKTRAKIIVACSKSNFDIFHGQKFIDEIYIFDSSKFNLKNLIDNIKKLRKEHADISIDTGQTSNISAIMAYLTSNYSIGFEKNNNLRNRVYDSLIKIDCNKHMIHNYVNLLSPLGIKYKKKLHLTKLIYSKKDIGKINKILGKKKNIVGIHPFSHIKAKEWSYERFSKLIEFLCEKKYDILIVGDKKESELSKEIINKIDKKYKNKIINLSGKLNIKELIALMKKIKLFIANDGGPMHIAAAMNVPTLGLFGYENPKRYAPLGEKNITLYNVKDHNSCDKRFMIEWPKCRNPEHINKISIEEVKNSINKIEKNK